MFKINEIANLVSQYHTGTNSFGWINYLYQIQEIFQVIENKTVLEIGPYAGNHTYFLREFKPKSITLVEPNYEQGVKALQDKYPNCEVIHDDIMLYLEHERKFDVVMCFGVLYHLHSPIHLLELIANRCDPEYILLETTTGKALHENHDDSAAYVSEDDNTPGNRYTVNNWKSAKMSMSVAQPVIDNALVNLGYNKFYDKNLHGIENICDSKIINYASAFKKI